MGTRVPPLAERQRPGLSETLAFERHPLVCQACGADLDPEDVLSRFFPQRWIECDAWDQKTATVVVLSRPCEGREIERNHRLYHEIEPRAPYPGASPLCADCPNRDGLRCALARAFGGPGVWMQFPKPSAMHIYCGGRGGRRSGWIREYSAHPSACSGHPTKRCDPPAASEVPAP